jgi:hypothetical protein
MTMNQTAGAHTRSPSPAERMRLHRKRRRRGLRHVGILLHVTEIEALVRKGHLESDQRENIEALQCAVCDLLAQALEDSA